MLGHVRGTLGLWWIWSMHVVGRCSHRFSHLPCSLLFPFLPIVLLLVHVRYLCSFRVHLFFLLYLQVLLVASLAVAFGRHHRLNYLVMMSLNFRVSSSLSPSCCSYWKAWSNYYYSMMNYHHLNHCWCRILRCYQHWRPFWAVLD